MTDSTLPSDFADILSKASDESIVGGLYVASLIADLVDFEVNVVGSSKEWLLNTISKYYDRVVEAKNNV